MYWHANEPLACTGHEQAMETYLILCPTHRDDRELALLARPGLRLLRHEYASLALEQLVATPACAARRIPDPLSEIDRIMARVSNERITGVLSTDDYPGSALACAVAERLGLPGADPGVSLLCQHKYHARAVQRALVPEAVPQFALIDVDRKAAPPPMVPLPAFVKPIKSFFSVGAQRLTSLEQLVTVQNRWANLGSFFRPFERLLECYAGLSVGRQCLLVEGLLQGVQATLEGYALGSEIHIVGIVDSIMFPGTIAFERFEYPSSLPTSVQDRMAAIAQIVMSGVGFQNAMFNIEFMYDPVTDGLSIIEINPRMASQFADLYEKVDGFNTYSILLDLAAGRTPRLTRRRGPHKIATSCVFRTFQDMHVVGLPSPGEIEELATSHPEIRVEILASAGHRLSEEMQDGHSFRYGIVNLGGRDRQDIREKFDDCRQRLSFIFAPTLRPSAERRRFWGNDSGEQDRAVFQAVQETGFVP
jgi:hypothetical protein